MLDLVNFPSLYASTFTGWYMNSCLFRVYSVARLIAILINRYTIGVEWIVSDIGIDTEVCWWQLALSRGFRDNKMASSVLCIVLQGARSRKYSHVNCVEKCCALKHHWSGTSPTNMRRDRKNIAVWSANAFTALETRLWLISTPTTSRDQATSILNSFRTCLLYDPPIPPMIQVHAYQNRC